MKIVVKKSQARRNARRGLTLIELLLVLIILIGLASLLVPLFGNVVGLTHGASSAGNIEEVTRNLENHKAMFGGYPDELDLLLDSTNAIVPFGGTLAATELTTTTPDDRIIDALLEAGLNNLIQSPVSTEEEQTTIPRTLVPIDGTPSPGTLVVLGADAIGNLGLVPTDADEGPVAYVVLGVGNNNDGIGRSMVSAPVHFLPNGGNPEGIYARFLAVFRIPAGEGAAILSNVCTVDEHDGVGEIIGLNGHITEYYHTREQ